MPPKLSPAQERKIYRAEHPRTQKISLKFNEARVARWMNWCAKRDLFLSDFIEDSCQEAVKAQTTPGRHPVVHRDLMRTLPFPPEFVERWRATAEKAGISLTDWIERVLCDKLAQKKG